MRFSWVLAFSLLEKVQHVCFRGDHLAYYHPPTQRVYYERQDGHDGGIDVFQRPCPTLSDLDVYEDKGRILIAMTHHRGIELVQVDPISFQVHAYPFPATVHPSTYLCSCSFLRLPNGPSLVCWSIDGTKTVHLLWSPEWHPTQHPFHVHHTSISENTMGILDQDRVFHLFHPDGTYRNKTIEGKGTVSACHFSLSARKLAIGFTDGTLRIDGAHRVPYTRCFHTPIQDVYADHKRFLLFLENGHVLLGEMKPTLPILQRWFPCPSWDPSFLSMLRQYVPKPSSPPSNKDSLDDFLV